MLFSICREPYENEINRDEYTYFPDKLTVNPCDCQHQAKEESSICNQYKNGEESPFYKSGSPPSSQRCQQNILFLLGCHFQVLENFGMSHERGELGHEWNVTSLGSPCETCAAAHSKHGDIQLSLEGPVLDLGVLHSLALFAFKKRANQSEIIDSPQALGQALEVVCSHTDIDPLTSEETNELWVGPLNFGEFFLLTREFVGSVHRTLNSLEGDFD